MKTIHDLLATPELPDLGPGPRAGVQSEASLTRSLAELFRGTKFSSERQNLLTALVLLWHDHLDPAHSLAQAIPGPDGAFVHGIMHRREPDYGNAAYWFQRVGRHGAFPVLAANVKALLETSKETGLLAKLLPRGQWDAFAFINACEQAASSPSSSQQQHVLRDLQRLETETLLDWFQR
jgi:hypothetical protein